MQPPSLVEPLLSEVVKNQNSLTQPDNEQITQNDQENITNNITGTSYKSKNINVILAYTFFTFSARSLWNQSVLPAFIYLLRSDDPKFVGIITAIMGVSQLLTSFPAGILADKYRRDSMLKIGSVMGMLAAVSTFLAARVASFVWLGVGLAIWGLFWGICNTSVSALFADSIPDGDRSHYFTQRMIIQMFGNTFGPATALLMFSRLGEEWTTGECAIVVCVGQVLAIPGLAILCCMNDDYCNDDDVDGNGNNEDRYENGIGNVNDNDIDEDDGAEVGFDSEIHVIEDDKGLIGNDTDAQTNTLQEECQRNFLCIPSQRVVAFFIASADVLSGLAAGMSIRYFPIFFLDNLKLSPTNVQVIYIVTTIMMTIFGKFVQWFGIKIGRVQTTIICKWIGAFFFLAMIHAYQRKHSAVIVCSLYVFRTTFMNACNALTKSALMDHVPKEERAKWSSLESVNMFSWAGSAAVGGFLVDMKGLMFNFYATVLCQLFATIPLMMIVGRVRSEN